MRVNLLIAGTALLLLLGCQGGAGQAGPLFDVPAGGVGVSYRLPNTPAHRDVWLALPVFGVLKGASQSTVTDVTLLPQPAASYEAAAFQMSVSTNGGRHITILEDRYFKDYGLTAAEPLEASTFMPGPDDAYIAIKARFATAGDYHFTSAWVDYRDSAGRRGSQELPCEIDLIVRA
jgi:hypothetical protein